MLYWYQFLMPYWYQTKTKMRLIMVNTSFVFSSEAVVRKCSVKKVFLEISQNSQKITCATVSFLVKLQAWGLQFYLLKKKPWHRCFSMNFAKFLRAPPVVASVTYRITLIKFMVTLLIRCKLKWAISFKCQLHLYLPRFAQVDVYLNEAIKIDELIKLANQ